jgi:hypothetical protein
MEVRAQLGQETGLVVGGQRRDLALVDDAVRVRGGEPSSRGGVDVVRDEDGRGRVRPGQCLREELGGAAPVIQAELPGVEQPHAGNGRIERSS